MLASPFNNTLYGSKNRRLAKANAPRVEPDTPGTDTPEKNLQHSKTYGAGQMEHWETERKHVPLHMTPLNVVIMSESSHIWGDRMAYR